MLSYGYLCAWQGIADVVESGTRWPLRPDTIWLALLYVLLFGVLGIVLTAFGFKVFDWVLTRVDIERELAEKQNVAVAIVTAAVILAVGAVIVASIVG